LGMNLDVDWQTFVYLGVAAIGLATLFWIAELPPRNKRPMKLKSRYWKK